MPNFDPVPSSMPIANNSFSTGKSLTVQGLKLLEVEGDESS